jgi:two-component system, OmpR family, copper resistance phosphate regulon response regulator CusR
MRPTLSRPSSPKTVLVIEDDRPIFIVIKGHLEGAGYRVLGAESGPEGLAVARAGGVDLITLDVLMQPVDGWRVFHALRADPATQRIPIVFVTIVDQRPEGLVAEGYVTKPFLGRDLLHVIERALRAAE